MLLGRLQWSVFLDVSENLILLFAGFVIVEAEDVQLVQALYILLSYILKYNIIVDLFYYVLALVSQLFFQHLFIIDVEVAV